MFNIKKITSIALVGIMAISMSIPVSAQEKETISVQENKTEFIQEKDLVFSDDYVPQSLVNYSLDERVMKTEEIESDKYGLTYCESDKYDIVDIVVSKENVIIEANTFSEFIDVFGKLKDGTYVNITDNVECKIDENVATWIYGRILAEAKGKTTMVLTYNGVSKEIDVKVKKQIDFEKIAKEINKSANDNTINIKTISSSVTRQSSIDTARGMVNMKWTPDQTFNTWFGTDRPPFYAGTEYTGMPYTKYETQTTKTEFLYALENDSDFYTRVSYGSWLVPKYGNDCSGFVSICWGLTDGAYRDRWNTTDFNNAINSGTFDTIPYYSQIQQSDALLKSGHVILANYIYSNSCIPGGGYLYSYEQVDTKAHATSYTFQQLSDSGYTAFTRF